MNYIDVSFKTSSTRYTYMNDDPLVKVNDTVVVHTPYGYALAKVVAVNVRKGLADKFIVQRVNAEAYNQRLEDNKRAAVLEEAIKNLLFANLIGDVSLLGSIGEMFVEYKQLKKEDADV